MQNLSDVMIARIFFVVFALAGFTVSASAHPPKVYDDSIQLELFAETPDIVTPIGAVFDHQGRLLVIESHTHKRGPGYKGPKTDRIRIVEDTDQDGKADRFRTFYEGTEATMSLARGPDNWIYVATRMKIFRIRDRDKDDRADQEQLIVHLETKGDYPHNGLAGLALDGQGHLYFGMGENLGAAYRLIGSEGAAQSGSGEGGVFCCDLEGKNLKRIATGFWNPFGICVDAHQRVFAVGNDPSNAPPCRLVHVVETGDYGFQYKYGRSGRHPLQAWNGELAGTLPMVTGTGEAPCEVKIHQGRLWVAVWGDHRIERFTLQPDGASFRATREVVVQGDRLFRPVAIAHAPDGSLYFTDWIDKSYPVHGKGRIWRMSNLGKPSEDQLPGISKVEQQARDLALKADWESLKTDDLFLRQAAVAGIVRSGEAVADKWKTLADARQRLGLLQALRWKLDFSAADKRPAPVDLLGEALADVDPNVRLYAVRWIADAQVKQLRDAVEKQITGRNRVTPELFKASVVALDQLDKGEPAIGRNRDSHSHYFAQTVADEKKPVALRALALRIVSPDDTTLKISQLSKLLELDHLQINREVVRLLALSRRPARFDLLTDVVSDPKWPRSMRADAILGLVAGGKDYAALIRRFAGPQSDLSDEAERALARIDGKQALHEHPPAENIDQWMKLVGSGGDADAGWRVFYGAAGVRCADCHRLNGRGADTGPGLTEIVRRTSRRNVLESILQPSREIAPQYVPSTIVTDDGRVHQGLLQGKVNPKSQRERFLAADGTIFEIDPARVEARRPSKVSIMPDGLHQQLSLKEIRDLLALLSDAE